MLLIVCCLQLLAFITKTDFMVSKIGLATSDVLTYLDIKINFCIRFSRNDPREPCLSPMGLSGLEPPTSRLSGVRSNRLSYKPI